jgi:predicted nuclease with TOPRIM domain
MKLEKEQEARERIRTDNEQLLSELSMASDNLVKLKVSNSQLTGQITLLTTENTRLEQEVES